MLKNSTLAKMILDFFPLVLFFLSYKIPVTFAFFTPEKPIIFATFVLVISTILSLVLAKILRVKLDKINVYSSIAVVIFGGFTVFFNDERFIKIKLTIINGLFSLILAGFSIVKKPVLKSILGEKIEMYKEETWILLAWRFSAFFAVVAVLNEVIWRNFSTSFWVNYKVFLVLPLTFIFIALQLPFISKNAKPFEAK
jgi:intracellular septation protein